MSLLVDTSVWSLAFRRDGQPGVPEVGALRAALQGVEQVFTTGLVLQEVLQGFAGPTNRDQLVQRLSALAFLQPDKQDHIAAAEIRNVCRRRGIQIGTIDALLIWLFYERQTSGLGDRFLDVGILLQVDGFHRLLIRRFPFALYDVIEETSLDIDAIPDCRRDPNWIRARLQADRPSPCGSTRGSAGC